MKCDLQPNEIFNILKIHTYIYVIPHLQGTSFYFRIKKKKFDKKNSWGKKHMIGKKRFHRRRAACAGKYI